MSESQSYAPPREGVPAPVARIFGWGMLGVLAAFLINNVLIVSFNFPSVGAALSGQDGAGAGWLLVVVYAACVAAGVGYVLSSGDRSLRWDARIIHNFNIWLIRACFWAVLLVGIGDAIVAFIRVEQFAAPLFGDQAALNLGLSRFVGAWIHMPLIAVGFALAFFTRTLGFTWLALLIVVAELLIVVSRFVFSYEQAFMGDLVRYWYAALFLFASAFTLFEDGHVRVDVLYASFGHTKRGFVNAWGSLLLGVTTCWVVIAIGFGGKQSIINSPVANFEVTQTGGTGLFVKYQMAMFLGIFAITMLVQFISYFLESVADWRDEPGRREVAPVSH